MDIDIKNKTVFIKGPASEFASLWLQGIDNKTDAQGSCMDKNNKPTTFKSAFKTAEQAIRNNVIDTGPFEQSAFLKAISEQLSDWQAIKTPRRRRCLSEYDGEYDHDRRYEIKPFQSTVREQQPSISKTITLNFDFSISCGTSRQQISEYGVLCYSVVNFLETKGFSTEINIQCKGSRAFQSKHCIDITANVKRFGQYQNKRDIMKYFTDYFYRRCVFYAFTYANNRHKSTLGGVDYGLGCSTIKTGCTASNGVINIAPNIVSGDWNIRVDTVKQLIQDALK